ncbi:MAG: hypothetical protein JOZ49_12000 [Mycolicibacterium sp.]|nr:hypothetical protein [Mycolicibacterium sp.]
MNLMVESPHRGTTTYTELKGHLSRCDEKRRGEGKPELLPRGTVDLFLEGLGYMSNWLIEVDKRIGATTGIEGTTSIVWQLNQNRPGDGYFKDHHIVADTNEAKESPAAQEVARVVAAWRDR